MIILLKQAGTAKYRQVADHLRDDINNNYQPGEMLPSEPVLSEKFAVNRHTIRAAVDVLISEGLVERMQGVGTRVVDQSMVYSIGADTRFTEVFDKLGLQSKSTIITKEIVEAPEDVRRHLALGNKRKIFRLDTIRTVEDQPISLVRHYLVNPYADQVHAHYEGGSLHAFLDSKFHVKPSRRQSFISVKMPSPQTASLLKISPSLPIMCIKNVNVIPGSGEPVEFGITTFRGDRVELSVNFLQQQTAEGTGKRS